MSDFKYPSLDEIRLKFHLEELKFARMGQKTLSISRWPSVLEKERICKKYNEKLAKIWSKSDVLPILC